MANSCPGFQWFICGGVLVFKMKISSPAGIHDLSRGSFWVILACLGTSSFPPCPRRGCHPKSFQGRRSEHRHLEPQSVSMQDRESQDLDLSSFVLWQCAWAFGRTGPFTHHLSVSVGKLFISPFNGFPPPTLVYKCQGLGLDCPSGEIRFHLFLWWGIPSLFLARIFEVEPGS